MVLLHQADTRYIAGHVGAKPSSSLRIRQLHPCTLAVTRDYLLPLQRELAKAADAEALVAAMQAHYPQLGDREGLSLGAKILKGEMQWP